jgi:hypothetical protein
MSAASSSFRRDRKPGITQAQIERAIRAAQATSPSMVVEVDPLSNTIRIIAGAPPVAPDPKAAPDPLAVSQIKVSSETLPND